MKPLLTTLTATALAAALAVPAMAQTIRLGTEGAYPPYNFVNDNGEVDGFERELGDKLCEMTGLDCTWVTNEWDSIIPNLVSGNYDVIIAGMSITDERDEVIDGRCRSDGRRYCRADQHDSGRSCRVFGRDTSRVRQPGRNRRGCPQRRS